MFLSFSFDSLLSRGSRDIFAGFLARSVLELWLIKGLPRGWRGGISRNTVTG